MNDEERFLDRNPLIDAARAGDLEQHRGDSKVTTAALHDAINNVYLEVVTFLLDNGADANGIGIDGWTPMFRAVNVACDSASQLKLRELQRDALSVIQLLIARGADTRETSGVAFRGEKEETIIEQMTPSQLARQYDRRELLPLLEV